MDDRQLPEGTVKVNYLKINGDSNPLMVKEGYKYPLYPTGTMILEQNASKELVKMADNSLYTVKLKERDPSGNVRNIVKFRVERVTRVENKNHIDNMPQKDNNEMQVIRENGESVIVDRPKMNNVATGGLDAVMAEMAKQNSSVSERPKKKKKRA